jgi:peptidoglycan/LPS O-acetylase OafA/YrhL
MSDLKYRPEIDGLRAIAVMSVVLFHAVPQSLPGGYVGVDIFFVISGYLICSIIAKAVSEGRFSLIGFYERRARRILPPLVLVMVVALVAGYFIMLPDDFEELGASATAASFFAANFYFWKEASYYFSGANEYAPLLHTWSLGVEEQFYIVAPLVLGFTIRRHGKRGAFLAVLVISVISLGVSIAFSRDYASMSFYLPLTRTYELGIGALIALAPKVRLERQMQREALSTLGLAMMAAAIFLYDSSTTFPGAAALLPCVGAGLVILAADRDTLAGRLLSLGPIVFVGLVSYSFYLWHWPVLAFARYSMSGTHLPLLIALICIATAFLMAILSLKFVETPFRSRTVVRTNRAMFTVSGGALAVVVLAGTTAFVSDGSPNRFSDDERFLINVEAERNLPDGINCEYEDGVRLCTNSLTAQGEAPTVVFIGDSHARASAPFVLDALAKQDVPAISLSRGGCPPVPDLYRTSGGNTDRNCPTLTQQLLSNLDAYPQVRVVVIHARWALYGTGERQTLEAGGPVFVSEADDDLNLDPLRNLAILQSRLALLTDEISNRNLRLMIVGSVPEIGWDVPRALTMYARFGLDLPALPNDAAFGPDTRGRTDAWLESFAEARTDLTYVSVVSTFCKPICEVRDGLVPYYSDGNHLSWRGAEIFSQRVGALILERLE